MSDIQQRHTAAREFIMSSELVRKENAVIKSSGFKVINLLKKFLRKIGLFNAVKKFIAPTSWWQSKRKDFSVEWGFASAVADGFYFYQSFPMLDIKGLRPTDLRIETYGLYDILSGSMDVLDIGCNAGFLDMTIADRVHTITGIEYSKDYSALAKGTAEILGLDNVTFINADANEWLKNNINNRYDMILSFSVHIWLNVKAEDYSKTLYELLNPGGYLVFESHGPADNEEYHKEFLKLGMEKLRGGAVETKDVGLEDHTVRMWSVFRKNSA